MPAVWKDTQTDVSGKGWSTELLKKALSANFIDLHYALGKNPEFRLEDVVSSEHQSADWFLEHEDANRACRLCRLSRKKFPEQASYICWIHHDPGPVQNILCQDLNISTVALSRTV